MNRIIEKIKQAYRIVTTTKSQRYTQIMKLKCETKRGRIVKMAEGAETYTNSIFEKIESTTEFKESTALAIYWSMKDEVCTHQFIKKWSDEKLIFIPMIFKRRMHLVPYKNAGIYNPQFFKRGMQKRIEKMIEIIILPGLVFDRHKNRVGRGGNYYDKYLKTNHFIKWGVCYNYQIVEQIPSELDIGLKVDMVFSENMSI